MRHHTSIFSLSIFYLFIAFAAHTPLIAVYPVHSPRESILEKSWEQVLPHLLPEDSEIKKRLDGIFKSSRATLNSSALKQVGFTTGKSQKFSHIVVTKHENLPGYIFKIYLDDERRLPRKKAFHFLVKRVLGACLIQKIINEHALNHLFKVPKKWLYLLPDVQNSSKKYSYKDFIVVEEDMEILGKDENKKAWKSTQVTEETLAGLYIILTKAGLIDGTKLDNIPFSIDGKIAFVDTESTGSTFIPFRRLKKSLSSEMKHFWTDFLIDRKEL